MKGAITQGCPAWLSPRRRAQLPVSLLQGRKMSHYSHFTDEDTEACYRSQLVHSCTAGTCTMQFVVIPKTWAGDSEQ